MRTACHTYPTLIYSTIPYPPTQYPTYLPYLTLPHPRFQGVALPKEIHLNHFAYSVLERRAARLNLAGLNTTRVPSPV